MDGKVVIGCDLDTRSFDAQIDYVESQMQEIERELKKADMGFEVGDTQKLEANYEKLGIKLDSLRKKQAKLNQEQANMGKLDLSRVQTGINNVNKGLQGTIKKVAKWGLALFGIRTAYNAIRGAMSTLSQYDTQMADNIEYIRYALASTLQPVIQTILNLVVKLLQYINYIAKAWTGKNLFKTADAFKNAQKNAKGLNKELNKTITSFDEINKVSDSSLSKIDISTPNIDLTGMQGEVPEWLQWIVDHKDEILAIMSGVATGLLAWNLGFKGIKSLGIGLLIGGIILAIESLLGYLNDPSWENFGGIIEGIGVAMLGLGIITGNVGLMIAGAIAIVVGVLVKYWEKIKSGMINAINWIDEKIEQLVGWLTNKFGVVGTILGVVLGSSLAGISDFVRLAMDTLDGIFVGVKQILDGIIMIFRGDFNNGIITVGKGIVNILIGIINGLINGINVSLIPLRSVLVSIGKLAGKKVSFSNIRIPTIPRLAKGGIINQPGRGVPIGYGQAIGGENRAEGVIPLTDSQQMALLGEAIGKYVRIDNVIDVNMDSRRINRILQSSSNRVAFAGNR